MKNIKNSCSNILIYHIGYMTVQNLRYIKTDSVNFLHLYINKINAYFEEMLVSTDASKEMKKYEELWSKIKDIIRLKTNN